MLIVLFTILFLGGGSTGLLDYIGEAEDSVKVVVEDDERRKWALETVSEMKKRTRVRNKSIKASRKSLSRALGNPDVTMAEIDVIWDDYFDDVESYNAKLVDLRFELRNRLTRDEWEQIFSSE